MTATNPGLANLVAWWALDEESGNRSDEHTNNYTLVDTNTVLYGTGKQGNAADFERDNDEYLIHNAQIKTTNFPYGDNNITVTAWVKLETNTGTRTVCGAWNTVTGERVFQLQYNHNTPAFEFKVHDGSDEKIVVETTEGGADNATWYFVTGWHDKTNNVIGIAVDQGGDDTEAWTTGMDANPAHADTKFVVGATCVGTLEMDGLEDECNVWNDVLTSNERDWLYDSGDGRTYAEAAAVTSVESATMHRRTRRPGSIEPNL